MGGTAGGNIQSQQIEKISEERTKSSIIESDWWLGEDSQSITVCYVVHHSDKLAGSERSLLSLIDVLRDKGVRPIVVSDYGSVVVKEAEKRGIKTAEFPIKNYVMDKDVATIGKYIKYPIKRIYNWIFHRRMSVFLINESVDIVHINTAISFYEWGEVAANCGIPYIFHLREFVKEDYDKVFVGEKHCMGILKQATKRIAISNAVKEYWEIKLQEECELVYNGIDVDEYYKKKEILDKYTINCVMIGRVHKNKCQLDAVKMIKKLKEKGLCSFTLTVIGFLDDKADEYELELKKYVKEYNLEGRVFLKHYSDNVSEEFNSIDVGLMLSKAEAFGRTTVEYALGGLLVVGADTAATRELIRDNNTGIIFRQGDVNDLADKMEWIMNNRGTARNIAKNGQEFFMDNFTSYKNAEGVLSLYREIIW